jgi:hypothetical protein
VTDPNALLYFPDVGAFDWKVDQLAHTNGERDEFDLLRYATVEGVRVPARFVTTFREARQAVLRRRAEVQGEADAA